MPDFLGAFYFYMQDVLQMRDGHEASIEICEAGVLVLTSGRIVACDGLIPSDEPFTQTVKPGSYPVILSIALFGEEWPTVACAMLRLRDKMPTTWKLATVEGQSEVAEQEGKIIGYGVDCGVGCFADLNAMRTLTTSPDTYNRLQERVHQPGVEWVDFHLDAAGSSNIIVFSSGEGDGTYPSYFGYDAEGNVLCLATDFGVIAPLPEKQTEKPNKDQLRLDF